MKTAKIIESLGNNIFKAYIDDVNNYFHIKMIDGEAYYSEEFDGDYEFVGDDFKIIWPDEAK